MIISTFNIQNDFRTYKKEKSSIIYNYLKDNNIDVLGLQEVFSKCNNDLLRFIKNKYKMLGKYRFILPLLHFTSNEKTPIVTNYEILKSTTYRLPYKPAKLKRVMTHVVIKYNDKEISIYNTHLEARIKSVKEEQLNFILEILKKDERPKILMGDFNLNINDTIFNSFIKSLEKLNMRRVDIKEKTFKEEKDNHSIDHIFVDNGFKIIKKEVIKTLDISDHYPVIIEIK